MTDNTESLPAEHTAPSGAKQRDQKGGLLERTVTRLFFMKPVQVTANQTLSPNFRLIEFRGEGIKENTWSPGDKVQVKLDGGFITRTYTPIEWDVTEGRTQFLAYCHGNGPGSDWAKDVAPGDERQFFGPRSSISLADLGSSAVLFGDETSFAIALALEKSSDATLKRQYIFEVNDKEESAAVLEKLGLPSPILIERQKDDAHLNEIGAAILATVQLGNTYILSGKAQSIQYVSRALKAEGVNTKSLRTKAYWAPGKTGLD